MGAYRLFTTQLRGGREKGELSVRQILLATPPGSTAQLCKPRGKGGLLSAFEETSPQRTHRDTRHQRRLQMPLSPFAQANTQLQAAAQAQPASLPAHLDAKCPQPPLQLVRKEHVGQLGGRVVTA